MIVRAMSALSPSVRGMFRDKCEELSAWRPLKQGRGVFSEGRGQRFESSWVRHHFQTICPCYRQCHPLLFRLRSAIRIEARSGAGQRRLARREAREPGPLAASPR
jgi:hypothetical protein